MSLALTIVSITFPVFALASLGVAWARLGYEYDLTFVSRLSMTVSVPCLIFVALMETRIDPQALLSLSLASFLTYGAIAAIFAVILAVAGLSQRTYLSPLTFGNTGNLGLPLAMFAFGQEGLDLAVVVFAVMALINFSFGVWLVSGGGSFIKVLKEPLVGATLLGTVFLAFGWQTPEVITNTLRLIGQIAIPLMLITLGVALARLRIGGIGRAAILSGLKVLVCVLAAVLVGRVLGLPDMAGAVLVMQTGTPVAVTSYMLALKYGADGPAVAELVVVSTVMSLLAIPALLAFVL